MYLTAFLAAVLTIVGLVTIAWCFAARSTGRRVAAGLVGGVMLALGIFLIAALVFFRPTTCRALGGHMTGRGHCTAEFGGGGDNG